MGSCSPPGGKIFIQQALLNICNAGDSIIAVSQIYGGTVNLFGTTFKKLGIECIWVDNDADEATITAAFKPNTKAVFGEMLANTALTVMDIEKFAKVAHAHGVPLIVDNTFPTPILCRPFDFGADIVVHSTTKYMDGHAVQVGGVIVDSGNFDWTNGKYPEFTEPDESYHGTVYTKDYRNAPYIIKARMQLMRDFGVYPSAHSAFLLNLGLETMPLRMKQYCANGLAVAEYLATNSKVENIKYPGLKGDKYYDLAQKYLKGAAGIITLNVRGGREAGIRFMDGLKLATREITVADIRTCVLHLASTTHRQLTEEQLEKCGLNPGMVRFSVGLEDIDDIIADIEQSLMGV